MKVSELIDSYINIKSITKGDSCGCRTSAYFFHKRPDGLYICPHCKQLYKVKER